VTSLCLFLVCFDVPQISSRLLDDFVLPSREISGFRVAKTTGETMITPSFSFIAQKKKKRRHRLHQRIACLVDGSAPLFCLFWRFLFSFDVGG
jgi:hypothetical protein